MENNVCELKQLIGKASNIVFFGGAGVSTESGIPDFRSVDGLYRQKYKYPPETYLSHSFFMARTAEFFDFYREKMLYPNAKPNFAHRYLAELEAKGKLKAVVTQNIDGLHQTAGSKNVFELHGSVLRNSCRYCGKKYGVDFILNSTGIPRCECGGVIKPDVVLYEEGLDDGVVSGAVSALRKADLLIVGGTSLVVYPAAGMIDYYGGKDIVLINRDATANDSVATLLIHGKIGEVFRQLDELK